MRQNLWSSLLKYTVWYPWICSSNIKWLLFVDAADLLSSADTSGVIFCASTDFPSFFHNMPLVSDETMVTHVFVTRIFSPPFSHSSRQSSWHSEQFQVTFHCSTASLGGFFLSYKGACGPPVASLLQRLSAIQRCFSKTQNTAVIWVGRGGQGMTAPRAKLCCLSFPVCRPPPVSKCSTK